MKITKLNARGLAHIAAPLLFVIGIALVGTYMLVASNADSTKVSCVYNGKSYKGSREYNCKFNAAPVLDSTNAQVGTISAGTHWVLCELKGGEYYKTSTVYNNWWAYTFASNGKAGWINATYGTKGKNNGGFANVPNCNNAHGAAPTSVGIGAPAPTPTPTPQPQNGVLPIPSNLTGSWTAPAGTYSLPKVAVNISTTVTVNLSAATITGNTGYLFNLQAGGHLTITGGKLSGSIVGLVLDSVPDGGAASVSVNGTSLTNVRSVVYAKSQGGPISVTLSNVTASGLGDGVRATATYVDIEHSTLTGGGQAPSGDPAGVHMLDDNAGNVAVAGTYMKVFNSTITGYTSSGFQGDSLLGETRVAAADIENNTLGHNSDSGGVDSKMRSVTFKNNIVYSDGDRAIASHYGTLTSSGNTIYQVATSHSGPGKAYQGSGTLNASNDTLILANGGSLVQADVVLKPGSGPASTYPRVGHITLTHITDRSGNSILGPKKISSAGGYTPVVTINP